jgi:hypothetical protein
MPARPLTTTEGGSAALGYPGDRLGSIHVVNHHFAADRRGGRAQGVATRAALTMMRFMRRSGYRAALTEALATAIARFDADLRRLARTVLEDELDSRVATLAPMRPPTGARALLVDPRTSTRNSPMARPRQPVAVARRTTAARISMRAASAAGTHVDPAAAARTSKSAAATVRRPTAARERKPAVAAQKSKRVAPTRTKMRAAAGANAEPAAARIGPSSTELRTARPSIAVPVPTVAGTPGEPPGGIEGPRSELAAMKMATEQVEPTTEPTHAASTSAVELAPARMHDETSWEQSGRTRRDESAERRNQRQDHARVRREGRECAPARPRWQARGSSRQRW